MGQIAVANAPRDYVERDRQPGKIGGALRPGLQSKWSEMEQEALQNQLRRMQKMEAIGTLAGHRPDFNNILSAILAIRTGAGGHSGDHPAHTRWNRCSNRASGPGTWFSRSCVSAAGGSRTSGPFQLSTMSRRR